MSAPASKFWRIYRQRQAGEQASEQDDDSLQLGGPSWGTQPRGTWPQVVIEDGVLQGVAATVLGTDERQMLIVAVRLLMRWVVFELPPDAVRWEDPDSLVPTPLMH